jgi:hypothetical protein
MKNLQKISLLNPVLIRVAFEEIGGWKTYVF